MSKMERHLGFLCIALALVTVAIGFGNAACPATEQIDSAILQCFGDISNDVYFNFTMVYLSAFCSNDEYTNALACAENIYNDCVAENNEVKDILEKFIEFESYAETFEDICDDIEVLGDNDACIQNAFDLAQTAICILESRNTYIEQLAELPSMGLESRLEVTCSFFYGIGLCVRPQYMTCGPEVEEMLNRTLSLFGPNSCQPISSQTLVTQKECREPIPRIAKCFNTIGLTSTGCIDKDVVSALCHVERYRGALMCIETLYNDCVDLYPETQSRLDKIIIMDKYTETFEYICDNIQAIAENEQCIDVASRVVPNADCLESGYRLLQADLTASGFTVEDVDEAFPYFCKYWYGDVECRRQAYGMCAREVTQIVMAVDKLLLPQGCVDLQPDPELPVSGSKVANSNGMMILGILGAMLGIIQLLYVL